MLLLAYWLIRKHTGPVCAAVGVALIGASSTVFAMSTRAVESDLPYAVCSLGAVLVFERLERDGRGTAHKWFWYVTAAVLLVATTMLRAIGVSLLIGVLLSCLISYLRTKSLSKRLLAVIGLGLAIQAAWMIWSISHAPHVPRGDRDYSYGQDFFRKNPHDPDLGPASSLW